jgi:hypothetical protein
MPRGTLVQADETALLHVLEAYIETLKAENEILKRRIAVEARTAQEIKADRAIGEKKADAVISSETAMEPSIQPPRSKRRWWWRLVG